MSQGMVVFFLRDTSEGVGESIEGKREQGCRSRPLTCKPLAKVMPQQSPKKRRRSHQGDSQMQILRESKPTHQLQLPYAGFGAMTSEPSKFILVRIYEGTNTISKEDQRGIAKKENKTRLVRRKPLQRSRGRT
ncbi:hypothetical protein J1N35_013024 [Gossypium stocksii]|uniref:Uncharacterized protein n=1 Tax=Gossypium stocksii TaxID=47602 RepID=A0A9D3VSY2_9ROSI|nr:hypothetical protein J1N35_013024 [Gossypium stocksii]